MPQRKDGRREPPPAASSALSTLSSAANGTFHFAREAVMASVAPEHRRQESIRILSDLAPTLMQPKFHTPRAQSSLSRQPLRAPARSLLRFPGRASKPPPTATSLAILENAEGLADLSLDVDETQGGWTQPKPGEERVSLIRGFRATIPSSELSKQRRRLLRGEITDGEIGAEDGKLGLKKLGDRARGLLTDGRDSGDEGELSIGRKTRRRKKKRDARRNSSGHLESKMHLEDLLQQADEIAQDKENLRIRQSLLNAEIYEVSQKMAALEEIRRRLDSSLLKLQEEGLELDDELEGVQELMASPMVTSAAGTKALPSSVATPVKSSRRRKGPAFLPSEHDELPSGVAFLTMQGHTAPITALDFDEPYGMLVTAGQDNVVKVWDLCDGEQIGELRGHRGLVKTAQVEDTLCLTGGVDGTIKLWDLRLVEDYEERLVQESRRAPLDIIEEDAEDGDQEDAGPCVRTLEGHSKSITAMYYEDSTLVTGSADKTIRQWDVTTGQCVQTMDILWAMSNPPAPPVSPQRPRPLRHRSSTSFGSVQYDDLLPPLGSPGGTQQSILSTSPTSSNFLTANFSVPTPPFSDGTWDMYADFVGGVQFWGYALASGSGDGAVRLWDMRTGQAHRTLTGHTAPVTCVQFDEHYIVSGSLDKTIRIWDFRMGDVAELHRYEYPVTAVQFDSRKVVACVGENGVEVYNRTTLEHKRLVVNGHTKPAERLRFIDKYLVSGGRDGCAKVWAM